jgi:hypothetical protein
MPVEVCNMLQLVFVFLDNVISYVCPTFLYCIGLQWTFIIESRCLAVSKCENPDHIYDRLAFAIIYASQPQPGGPGTVSPLSFRLWLVTSAGDPPSRPHPPPPPILLTQCHGVAGSDMLNEIFKWFTFSNFIQFREKKKMFNWFTAGFLQTWKCHTAVMFTLFLRNVSYTKLLYLYMFYSVAKCHKYNIRTHTINLV